MSNWFRFICCLAIFVQNFIFVFILLLGICLCTCTKSHLKTESPNLSWSVYVFTPLFIVFIQERRLHHPHLKKLGWGVRLVGCEMKPSRCSTVSSALCIYGCLIYDVQDRICPHAWLTPLSVGECIPRNVGLCEIRWIMHSNTGKQ